MTDLHHLEVEELAVQSLSRWSRNTV